MKESDPGVPMGFAPGEVGEKDMGYIRAALEWLGRNTDYSIDLDSLQPTVRSLPAGAHIFILKFIQIIKDSAGSNVASESIDGMSKSYGSASDAERSFRDLAIMLLGDAYKSGKVRTAGTYSRYQP